MTYVKKLEEAMRQAQSCLCVGLDPYINRLPEAIKQKFKTPEEQVPNFLKVVIDHTSDYCAAYKPNLGFFEALGARGLDIFEQVIKSIPDDKIIIADAKRGDISSTAEHYALAYFEKFDVDAITINPLMGFESLEPFLNYPEKGIYTLTLTSNPGADDFLNQPFNGFDSMAEYIANKIAKKSVESSSHVGMVVGATQFRRAGSVINHHPKGSLLIPGIGTQGGSIEELVNILKTHKGIPLVNSSRSILYADQHTDKWQQAVADKAQNFQKLLHPITTQYV